MDLHDGGVPGNLAVSHQYLYCIQRLVTIQGENLPVSFNSENKRLGFPCVLKSKFEGP